MDVDDVDGQLAQQLGCLGTNDREVLIAQFQQITGHPIDQQSCAFFLDMNNWSVDGRVTSPYACPRCRNLQAALCSYYDMGRAGAPPDDAFNPPQMRLLNDVTIGEVL
jgi:hypothetical protein